MRKGDGERMLLLGLDGITAGARQLVRAGRFRMLRVLGGSWTRTIKLGPHK